MTSAQYVLSRYAKECDVIKFWRLPIIERFEFNTTKLAFQSIASSRMSRLSTFEI